MASLSEQESTSICYTVLDPDRYKIFNPNFVIKN